MLIYSKVVIIQSPDNDIHAFIIIFLQEIDSLSIVTPKFNCLSFVCVFCPLKFVNQQQRAER